MPTPCPHPPPLSTTELPQGKSENQTEGTVRGSDVPLMGLTVGERSGAGQGPHALRSLRKVDTARVLAVPPPLTVIWEPESDVEVILPPDQSPAFRRYVVTSVRAIVVLQCETGDAPSSRSVTGRR